MGKGSPAGASEDGEEGSVRVSVTFPRSDYEELVRIAKDKRVSLAWVIRDAVNSYLAALYPLFRGRG